MITKPIPYGKHHISKEDINAVIDVLNSDYLTQGPKVSEFEKKFANYIGSKYAVSVSNATAALHLSAIILGVKKKSKVITTPLTFAATANCIHYCGGSVEFCDIDPKTLCLDIEKVKKKLESAPKGTYQGIIPVDFAGYSVNLEEFRALANKHNLWIIEDSCHAPGGSFIDSKGITQKCGNGNFADLAIFSFHPVKHIACGEGGMITTNNKIIYKKLLLLRSHGINKKNVLNKDGWHYDIETLGYNYRMPDILCSIGISQLDLAYENIQKRRLIASRYIEGFKNTSISVPLANSKKGHAYHLFIIQIENRLELYNYLRKNNIFCQVHYIPLHISPYYRKKYGEQIFPIAENYYERCLSLPMYPTLTIKEQEYVINKIISFYE
tara:strand:- start:2337 stop:3482 length:1146 start_codon:yes stop_codon:yes gene_type:complete